MFSEDNLLRYLKGLYPVAFLLLVAPLLDLTLRGFPPQFGTLQWRFAMAGSLLGSIGTVILGAGLMGLIGTWLGHRRLVRALGYGALVAAVLVLAVLALFALDALQMRTLAQAQFKKQVVTSALGALATGSLAVFAFAALGRGALASTRLTPANLARTGGRKAAPSLVVGGAAGAGESV